MDISGAAAAAVAAAGAVEPYFAAIEFVAIGANRWWRRCRRTRTDRLRQAALVLPRKSGKSYLGQFCDAIPESGGLVVETDALVSDAELHASDSTRRLNYLRVVKQQVEKLRAEFPRARILYICPSVSVARHLGVADTAIFEAAPSERLFQTILEGLSADEAADATKDRMNFLKEASPKRLAVYESLPELAAAVRAAFRLTGRL